MLAKDLLAIVKLGDAKVPCEGYSHVLLTPRGVAVHGGLDYAVRYACAPHDAPLASAPVLVPPAWLRALLGPAGAAAKGGSKGTVATFDVTIGEVEIPKTPAAPEGARRGPGEGVRRPRNARRVQRGARGRCAGGCPRGGAACGNFAKGGPVAAVLPSASSDTARAHVNAVHLADVATATDGHQIAQRPLRSRLPAGMLVPLAMARALCTIVDATKPERLVVRRTDNRAWFTGRTIDGARWTVSGLVDVCEPPPYAQVIPDVSRHPFQVDVDVEELRAMVATVGASRAYCAIYPCGGVVAWPKSYSEGVGVSVSMEAYDGTATPIVVWGSDTLPATIKALPKLGKVRVTADADSTSRERRRPDCHGVQGGRPEG